MRASYLGTLLLASLAFPAAAVEGVDLSMKSRRMAATSMAVPSKSAQAPFMQHARDPMPELVLREAEERRGPAGACENAGGSVCYDVASGKIVYRGARAYMPKVDGLKPESVSLRRGRLTLKYSFQ
jgi:hypothetical protein